MSVEFITSPSLKEHSGRRREEERGLVFIVRSISSYWPRKKDELPTVERDLDYGSAQWNVAPCCPQSTIQRPADRHLMNSHSGREQGSSASSDTHGGGLGQVVPDGSEETPCGKWQARFKPWLTLRAHVDLCFEVSGRGSRCQGVAPGVWAWPRVSGGGPGCQGVAPGVRAWLRARPAERDISWPLGGSVWTPPPLASSGFSIGWSGESAATMFRNSLKMLLTGGKANRKSRGSGRCDGRRRSRCPFCGRSLLNESEEPCLPERLRLRF
ncbi:unnamed protein product [Gadus morhua 'NCC']